jgi:UDP-N-acetylmuramate dehydrogenase
MMARRLLDPLRGELKMNVPMSEHTSWRAGGVAKFYYMPADIQDLADYLATLDISLPRLWLGLGSNLLIRDGGFSGTVLALFNTLSKLQIQGDRVYVEAGVACSKVARQSTRAGLVGAEFLAGIPGAMGGALAMNAGAFGGETWPLVEDITLMDPCGRLETHAAGQFSYCYRQADIPDGYGIVAATLKLNVGDGQLAQQRIRELLSHRSATQPTQTANAGSVFKNPEHDYAARLIEVSGLKQQRMGGAHVSDKHANFIINDRRATAADIEALIVLIQTEVKAQQGIWLEPEVRIVGDQIND